MSVLVLFITLAVLALNAFLCFGEVEPWVGSKLGTTEYRGELAAIEQAKDDYLKSLNDTLYKPRKELLCVSFLGLAPNSTLIMMKNIQYTNSRCDWAFILYAGTKGERRAICDGLNTVFGNVVHCVRAIESYVSEKHKKSLPKSVQYQSLLPVLPGYNKVLMMDEDISVKDLNLDAFLNIWNCGFAYRPLVVQPLIAENNQYIPYVNAHPWRNHTRAGVLASTVGYVEQQVPAMDSMFFEWYVRRVLSQTKELAVQYAMDWGHDRSWCNAAAMYAHEVLRWPRSGFNDSVPTPCALITSNQTMAHHLNHHTMKIVQGRLKTVRKHAFIVVQRYVDLFPTWVGMDLIVPYNPLNEMNAGKYFQISALDPTCVSANPTGAPL